MDKKEYWHIIIERSNDGYKSVSTVIEQGVSPVRHTPPPTMTVCLRGPRAKDDKLVTAYLDRIETARKRCIYRMEENRSLSVAFSN